jgi:hypothetical protein
LFPKYSEFTDNYEDKEYENEIRIELEEIIPGYKIDFAQYYESATLFGAKFLVDIYGALITLHSIGYVHGDVTYGYSFLSIKIRFKIYKNSIRILMFLNNFNRQFLSISFINNNLFISASKEKGINIQFTRNNKRIRQFETI